MNNQQPEFKNLPPVVTVESLTEKFGIEAIDVYHEISRAGGYGDYTLNDFVGGCPALDVKGLPTEAKREIEKILNRTVERPLSAPPSAGEDDKNAPFNPPPVKSEITKIKEQN